MINYKNMVRMLDLVITYFNPRMCQITTFGLGLTNSSVLNRVVTVVLYFNDFYWN